MNSIMETRTKRGAFLVFEGLDNSGKSTQSQLLVKSLRENGKDAEHMAFPDRTTPTGKIINEYLCNKSYKLKDEAIHLLFTANRFENVDKIRDLLLSGVNVVVDRYCYSGLAYSLAKKAMDANWCKCVESGLPAPDAVFFMDLPFEEIKKRPGFGGERYENISFLEKVHAEYEKLAAEYKFIKIHAGACVENIQCILTLYSLQIIKEVEETNLQYLDFINKSEKENINSK